MNARQAVREAAKRIEELEYYNIRSAQDIRDYNSVILSLISGGSACDWCEDQSECERAEKTASKGCMDWWLKYRENPAYDPGGEEETENALTGVLPTGPDSRT